MPITKRFITRLFVSLVLVAVAGLCSILIKETIDSLTAPENSLPTISGSIGYFTAYIERGGYEWNFLTRTVREPTISPPDLRLIITDVPAETPIVINFSRQPETLLISMSEGQYSAEYQPLDEEVLYTPSEPGIYTYSIEAGFDRGSIIYYFSINVKPSV